MTPPRKHQPGIVFVLGIQVRSEICTNATAHRRDPRRQRPLLVKVLRHDDNAWQEQQPVSNAHDDPLCDQQLSVAFANTRHHHAEDREEGAAVHQSAEVAGVVEWTRDNADE